MRERKFTYGSSKSLRSFIESLPTATAKWSVQEIQPDDGTPLSTVELHLRPVEEVLKQLLQDPQLMDGISFAPCHAWADAERTIRVYNNMWTGGWWWDVQVSIGFPGLPSVRS